MKASIQLKFYVFVIFYQKLIGLAPYSYNNSKKKFVTNKSDLIYPLLLILNYSYFYYVLQCQYEANAPSMLVTCFLCGRFTTTLLSWFVHCAHRKSIVKFFNAAFHLNDILNEIPVDRGFKILPRLLRAAIVTVANAGLHFCAISGIILFYQKFYTDESDDKIAIHGLNFLTFSLQAAISSTFFGMTLIAKLYFKKLNYLTSKVMSEAEDKLQHRQQQGNMVALNRLDDLCTRLDQMCHLHSQLTNLSKMFNGIYSFQLIMTFADYFANVLSNVYFMYVFLSTASDESSIFLLSLISTFASLFDVWRIGHTCDGLMKEAHKTGVILHRVYVPAQIDIRFQQSVEMFSIQLIQNKLEINACHMFTIDSTLLMAILISVTTHLIIIIQFDIAAKEMSSSN